MDHRRRPTPQPAPPSSSRTAGWSPTASSPPRPTGSAGACATPGCRPGDSVASLLPNGADLLAVYFAALQTGLYIVPVNWHLAGAEIAYILEDSGAKVLHRARAVRRPRPPAADAAGSRRGRFAVGAIAGFRAAERPGRGGSGRPAVRTLGAPMVYTSGTSGRPKGVRRPLTGADPDERAADRDLVLRHLRAPARSTTTCTCAARRSTTRRC